LGEEQKQCPYGPAVIRSEQMITAFVDSRIGGRKENQDSAGFQDTTLGAVIVVCDGMGGHEGGKMASEIAVSTFLTQYAENHLISNRTDMLIDSAKKSDALIFQLKNGQGDSLKAGSTLVSIIINRKSLMWCSVGDSRAYLIRGSEMVQLTQDHNYHAVLIEKINAGLLDEAEFKIESARGEALISFLGIGNLELIDYSESSLELKTDDKIIIMSDGLYKLVTDSEIARIIDNFNNIGEAVQALEMKAKKNAKNSNESRDNITIALIKVK
jgi:protein phosphatase